MCGQIPALQEASIEREGRVHKVNLLQMDNAIFAFCYEGTMKIGTLAVSTPGLTEGVVGTSSVLLGGKYLIAARALAEDRKSTRLNSSHLVISYAVFCLKKK